MMRLEIVELPCLLLAVASLLTPGRADAQGPALESMEKAIIRLAEKVGRSVVSVEVVNRLAPVPDLPKADDPEARSRYLAAWARRIELGGAWGSGYAVDETHVATASQVVPAGATRVRVVLPDGAVREATVTGRSDADRLVLLEVPGGGLTPLRHASLKPSVGEMVMSVGNTFEITQRMWKLSYSVGAVSGLYDLDKGFDVFYSGPVIETDAAVNPGVFGGPLVNRSGEVVGMLVSSFSYRRWLGCAIPSDKVVAVLAKLSGKAPAAVDGPAFDVPSLGVSLSESGEAWVVASVDSRGVADRLGWKAGDRIVQVGRTSPAGGREAALKAFQPGKRISVVLDKGGWKVSFDFKMPAAEGPEERDESEY